MSSFLKINLPESGTALPSLRSVNGLLNWLTTVDHKQIGIMYLLSGFLFLFVGMAEGALMRIQLIIPNNTFLTAFEYAHLFSMHGTNMIFMVLTPIMLGFVTYNLPLMIGANEMAFPRLNAFSFWVFFLGALMVYFSFLAGGAPDAGWFSYVPLSDFFYSPNKGISYWALGILTMGIGTTGAALNFIVTTLTLRNKGMKFTHFPLFVWMSFLNSFLILGAFPVLNSNLVMLLFDRLLGTHFYTISTGGDTALLYQNLFWIFGHPEVYILILPTGFGIMSEVFPVFSRKPIFGYGFVAASSVAIMLLSFGVWGHHMFTVGYGTAFNAFFSATSFLIAVPTGIKVFNWAATMWKGSVRFTTSMLFALAFLVDFTTGGLSGVAFAVVPTDWRLHNTYFVVAHIHYVFVGGVIHGAMAGVYYWFPKFTGRMLNEKIGKLNFWMFFIGFNLTFFVFHFLGLLGLPRRVYTYASYGMPYLEILNMISTLSASIFIGSFFVFLYNIFYSLRHGKIAGNNPWDAWTLEWYTKSPPPPKNFNTVPMARSARPLWDFKHPEDPDWKRESKQKKERL